MCVCDTDSPHAVSVPVKRRPSHTLQLPADDAGSHRYRLRTQVSRVSAPSLLNMCNNNNPR